MVYYTNEKTDRQCTTCVYYYRMCRIRINMSDMRGYDYDGGCISHKFRFRSMELYIKNKQLMMEE